MLCDSCSHIVESSLSIDVSLRFSLDNSGKVGNYDNDEEEGEENQE